jgi:rsbT co-antagonist protein RsbR
MLIALAVFLCIVGLAAFGIANLRKIGPTTTQLNTRTITEVDLTGAFHIALTRATLKAKNFAVNHDDGDLAQAHAALQEAQDILAQLVGSAANEANARDAASQQEFQTLNQNRAHLLTAIGNLMRVVEIGADADRQTSVDALEQIEGKVDQLDVTAKQLIERDKITGRAAADTAIQRGISSVGIAFGLIALLTMLAVILLRWRIVEPINTLAVATRSLASQGFDQLVQVTSADEIGELQTAFNQMVVTIREQTRNLEREVFAATTAQHAAEHAQLQIADQLAQIATQHATIREMSVPVLPLTPTTLLMPIVGALDTERLRLLQEQALRAIEQSASRYILLDITGIPILDTQVAQGLLKVIQAARLMGTEIILVGIRPEVAQSVIGLGIQLGDVVTRSTLQSGIAYTAGQPA